MRDIGGPYHGNISCLFSLFHEGFNIDNSKKKAAFRKRRLFTLQDPFTRTLLELVRKNHRIHNVDHAIFLINVGDSDFRLTTFFIGEH